MADLLVLFHSALYFARADRGSLLQVSFVPDVIECISSSGGKDSKHVQASLLQ